MCRTVFIFAFLKIQIQFLRRSENKGKQLLFIVINCGTLIYINYELRPGIIS